MTTNEFKKAFELQVGLSSSGFYRRDDVEMEAMIRRFNKDKMNGRVSLPEFIEELTAKCPEKPF